jgi:hypothetical protein
MKKKKAKKTSRKPRASAGSKRVTRDAPAELHAVLLADIDPALFAEVHAFAKKNKTTIDDLVSRGLELVMTKKRK